MKNVFKHLEFVLVESSRDHESTAGKMLFRIGSLPRTLTVKIRKAGNGIK